MTLLNITRAGVVASAVADVAASGARRAVEGGSTHTVGASGSPGPLERRHDDAARTARRREGAVDVDRKRGQKAGAGQHVAARGARAAEQSGASGAAGRRRWVDRRSGKRRRLQQLLGRPGRHLQQGRRPVPARRSSSIRLTGGFRRSCRRPRSGTRLGCARFRPPTRPKTSRPGRPAPTTIPSSGRSASAASSASDRRRVRRCCRCSTTTSSRSCRPRPTS